MIKREIINKIESLSKESECWNRYQCDDAYRCLENHKRCIKALYIYKKNDEMKSYAALDIYAALYDKGGRRHYPRRFTIKFDDNESFTEEDAKLISNFYKELISNLTLIYTSDDGQEFYMDKRCDFTIHCNCPATMRLCVDIADDYASFPIDMHKCAITDFMLPKLIKSYDYLAALYDCFNDPNINKKTLDVLMRNYECLNNDEKIAVSTKKDINTIASLSDSDYKACQNAVYNYCSMCDCRYELNMFLHGLSKINTIEYFQTKKSTTVTVEASNHADLHFRFKDSASYNSFRRIIAVVYGYMNEFFSK